MLWAYSVSHATLQLRLVQPGVEGNVHVICEACSWIESPDSWDDCALVLGERNDSKGRGHLVLQDNIAGFRVTCRQIVFGRNVAPVH